MTTAFWFRLGRVIGIASTIAWLYIIVTGQWRPILWAFVFSAVATLATCLVNVPMRAFWEAMDYPDGLSIPGLFLLVGQWRLALLIRVPQLVYGALMYGIGVAAFLFFGQSTHAVDRAALMMLAYGAAFEPPSKVADLLAAQSDTRSVYLRALTLHGRLAFLLLVIVNTLVPLTLPAAALGFGVATIVVSLSFEVEVARKPLVEAFRQ